MAAVLPAYQALAADPAALVEAVNQNLMFGRMSPELRDLITAATTAITDTSAGGLRERARGALYLAAISSEYSVYSDTSVAGAGAVQPPTGLAVSGLAGTDRLVELAGAAHRPGGRPAMCSKAACARAKCWRPFRSTSTTPSFTFRRRRARIYIRLRTVAGAGAQPSVERDSALCRGAGRTDRASVRCRPTAATRRSS